MIKINHLHIVIHSIYEAMNVGIILFEEVSALCELFHPEFEISSKLKFAIR